MDKYELKEEAEKVYTVLYDFREESLIDLKDSELKAVDRVLRILKKIKDRKIED